MRQVITTGKVPIKAWLDDIENGAMQQASNAADLPFAFKHVALMPDCHQGYGVPIGCVLATRGAVVPNAVGVDIGCGVVACDTGIIDISQAKLEKIVADIRKVIPVGFSHQKEMQSVDDMPKAACVSGAEAMPVVSQEYRSTRKQLGTLGGGNHFIEIQRGNGTIWVMIHSGSRNLGKKVADHYNKLASDLNSKWYSSVTKEKQLAFLPVNTIKAQQYLAEMGYCLEFAKCSRDLMLRCVLGCVGDAVGDFSPEPSVDVHHNYAALENHFGQNVWVHRKGATRARTDELGIVPGSQGTKSYIVRGLGCKDSFESCSHGAGRKMSRKAAQRELSLKQQLQLLKDRNVLHSIRSNKDLDEAPGAYKNIRDVMQNQQDLVDMEVKLHPLAVVKG